MPHQQKGPGIRIQSDIEISRRLWWRLHYLPLHVSHYKGEYMFHLGPHNTPVLLHTSLSGIHLPHPPNLLHISYLGNGLSSDFLWALLHFEPMLHFPLTLSVHMTVHLVSYSSRPGQCCRLHGSLWFVSYKTKKISIAVQRTLLEARAFVFWDLKQLPLNHHYSPAKWPMLVMRLK